MSFSHKERALALIATFSRLTVAFRPHQPTGFSRWSLSWDDTDNWEYNEEKDYHVIPEGWFESVSFVEEFGAVDVPVIAWREIAESYRLEEEDQEVSEE